MLTVVLLVLFSGWDESVGLDVSLENHNIGLNSLLVSSSVQGAVNVGSVGQPCQVPKDIAILVDSSGSWERKHYDRALMFVSDLLDSFTLGPNDDQVAVAVYSNVVHNLFGFNSTKTLSEKKLLIQNAPFLSHSTDTSNALTYAARHMFFQGDMRKGATRILLIISDGISDEPVETTAAATDLKSKKVFVSSIAVGSEVDETEMRSIATSNSDFYKFRSFMHLNMTPGVSPHSTDLINSINGRIVDGGCTLVSNAQATQLTTDIATLKTEYATLKAATLPKANLLEPVFRGTFSCGSNDAFGSSGCFTSYWRCNFVDVTFPTPYKRIPKVQTSFSYFDFDHNDYDHAAAVHITSITKTGFRVSCNKWYKTYLHTLRIRWISVPALA